MAKIMHGKSLSDLDEDKEYLVYYSGWYLGVGSSQKITCEGFGKIKQNWIDRNWHTTLYARGSNNTVSLNVTVTSINTSFIIEL